MKGLFKPKGLQSTGGEQLLYRHQVRATQRLQVLGAEAQFHPLPSVKPMAKNLSTILVEELTLIPFWVENKDLLRLPDLCTLDLYFLCG